MACQVTDYRPYRCVMNVAYYRTSAITERDMAQWLECGALSMTLPAVRFLILLGAGFSEKYWDIVSMLCPWEKHSTLKCFT